jgi:hypothetical protein
MGSVIQFPEPRQRPAPTRNTSKHSINRCVSCGYSVSWAPLCDQCRWYHHLRAVVLSRPKS